MNRITKAGLVWVNIVLSVILVYLISTPNGGYKSAIHNYIDPIMWIGLISALLITVWLAYASQKIGASLFISSYSAIILLLLPAIATGTLYGPDSYVRAGRAIRVFVSGQSENTFYPAMSVYSAMGSHVVDSGKIWILMLIATGISAPLTTLVFFRSYFGNLRPQLEALATTAAILSPLGFGMWLSTRSSYHSYYLTIPLAILLLGCLYRLNDTGEVRWTGLALLTGFAVSLYHPLAFLFVIAVVCFSLSSFTSRQVSPQPIRKLIYRWNYTRILLILFSISILTFNIQIESLLSEIGVFAFIIFGVIDTQESVETTCVESSTSPISSCVDLNTLAFLLIPILLFGIVTGIVGWLNLSRLPHQLTNRRVSPMLLAMNTMYLFFAGLMILELPAIFSRSMVERGITFGCFLSFVIILSAAKLTSQDRRPPSLKLAAIFFGGTIVFLTTAVIVVLQVEAAGIEYIAFPVVIATLAICSYIALQYGLEVHQIGYATLAVIVLLAPLLYPAPVINGVPNHDWSESEHVETKWVASYDRTVTDGQYATAQWHHGLHQYVEKTTYPEQYVGSVYLMNEISTKTGSEARRWNQHQEGQVVPIKKLEYVLLTGTASEYMVVEWQEGETRYRSTVGINDTTVERNLDRPDRIYTASEYAIVYKPG